MMSLPIASCSNCAAHGSVWRPSLIAGTTFAALLPARIWFATSFPQATLSANSYRPASIGSSQTCVFIAQNPRAAYQRYVRESLRKISQLTLCAWVVLFREQPQIVAHVE